VIRITYASLTSFNVKGPTGDSPRATLSDAAPTLSLTHPLSAEHLPAVSSDCQSGPPKLPE
jgi:hypothetical protein